MVVQLHLFLKAVLEEVKLSTSRYGRFTPLRKIQKEHNLLGCFREERKILYPVVHGQAILPTELSRLPFTIYHTLNDLLFMAFIFLEFVKCHFLCTRNHANSIETNFKLLLFCLPEHIFINTSMLKPLAKTGNPLA
jgi:hypothetical protein